MCQKWEKGIQSFYSSQTYSMQLTKKSASVILRLFDKPSKKEFFFNFSVSNWLLKLKKRMSTFFL